MLPDTTELEERLVHLEHLDEQRRDALTTNQAHKNNESAHVSYMTDRSSCSIY